MPRLRNVESRVVVNVDDATAARLVGKWIPADQPDSDEKPSKPAPATRRTRKK